MTIKSGIQYLTFKATGIMGLLNVMTVEIMFC